MNSAKFDKKKESILKRNILGKKLDVTIPGILYEWYCCHINEISVHNNTIRYSIQHETVRCLGSRDHFYFSAALYEHFIVKYCNVLDIKYHHLYIPPHKNIDGHIGLFGILRRCPVTQECKEMWVNYFKPLYRKETLPMIYENFN